MAVTFTPEQQKAIELHGRNILVSAAAGSGKTAVLVERIVQMVCEESRPVDIDRLLVVTFTNAAAAEMRERIADGISRRLTECLDSTESQHSMEDQHSTESQHSTEWQHSTECRHSTEWQHSTESRHSTECRHSVHIQRQATLLHNAQITTIDSFCLFLLRNHFNEIGLDPAFRIADEGEVRLMQQEALQELIEDSYASGSEAFRYCVEYFCLGGKESVLEQHILNLSRYAASFPWPSEWLARRKEDYAAATVEEVCASPYAVWLVEHLKRMVGGCVEKLGRVRALCEMPDGPYMYGELVDQELEQLEGLLSCASLEDFSVRLPAVNFGKLSPKKDASVSPAKRELAKEMRASVKKSIGNLEERYFTTPMELAARQNAACREPVCTLIDLVLDFDRRMREKKNEKKVIDFSDMEHYALDILLEGQGEDARPSAVALEYRQHFVEILTDEYQDSNLVQEYLLKAVSGEEDGHFNRFMVGDVKQSIYKFRLARPELFLEKYNSYEGEDAGAEDSGAAVGMGAAGNAGENHAMADGKEDGDSSETLADHGLARERGSCQRIDLARNFRSRIQVVETVNDVFRRLMSETVGGIPYDERAALYPGAVYPENPDCASELLLIEKPEKGDELNAKQAEALTIARKIKELRGSFSVTDKGSGGLRAARYSDMVILLRTNSGWDEEFKEVLEREGIPVYITSKTGYFAAVEVQELLQLLRVLDNPTQDIPLFGVLKSVFGGFSEEEIAQIRSGAKGCSLYDAMKRFAGIAEAPGEDRMPVLLPEPGAVVLREPGEGKGTEDKSLETLGSPVANDDTNMHSRLTEDEDIEGRTGQMFGVGSESGTETARDTNESQTPLQMKAVAFLNKIADYRSCTVYLPIRDLLTKLINDFGYLDYVTALPAGSRRRANVEMLLTKASDFEKTSYFGLFHFIRYMEQLEKYNVDYGGAELLDENADVVRIMSIHKSKGLEFPVTFVAGLSKRFNMQDVNQSLILDMDLGLATDYVDPVRRIRNKTLRRTALAVKLKEESLSEELRLLYVAMTRAREKLILTGTLEDAAGAWERAGEAGQEQLSYVDFMEAASFLDFLLPILPGTCIQVTVVEEEQGQGEEIAEQFQLHQKKETLKSLERYGNTPEKERLTERLNAVYPFAMLADLYTKTTVSELKIAAMADRDEAAYHTVEEKEVQPYIPLFRRDEEKVSGTVRGNAYHRVMELLDFETLLGTAIAMGLAGSEQAVSTKETMGNERSVSAKEPMENERAATSQETMSNESGHRPGTGAPALEANGTGKEEFRNGSLFPENYQEYLKYLQPDTLAANLRAFLQKEEESRRLSPEYAQAVRERKLLKFLRSEIAYRMWRAQRAGRLYREQPFVLGIDARRLKNDFPDTETVLIQGIIDVFFEEEDGLVLLDYKTDSAMTELWNRYETQLDYYQEAIQKLFGKNVKERILYSFHLETY